jgi:hypothetical protein
LELFDYEFDKELFNKLNKSSDDALQKLSVVMNIYSDEKIKKE